MTVEEIKTLTDGLGAGLTALAEKLQLPTGKIFEWAIRENYVKAISYLIGYVLVIICCIVGYKLFPSFIRLSKESEVDDLEFWVTVSALITFVVISVVGVVVFLDTYPELIGRFVNPEYHALLDILEQIKNLKS